MKSVAVPLLLLVMSCNPSAPEDGLFLLAPAKIAQVFADLDDLEAVAELILAGETSGEETVLERGPDGVSFSGFIEAEPGEYTIAIVFRGVYQEETLFLGRLVSDVFTVVLGDAAEPTFSRPLDTIGDATTEGDLDQDGLGILDEIIWGSDPDRADSDGDGLLDGEDCDPNDELLSFVIRSGGSIEDCDADGVLRVDLPWEPGEDCDDNDPNVFPGANDLCSDAVDSDCNPASCPLDTAGPSVTDISPAGEAAMGCYRRIEATIVDISGIEQAEVTIIDSTQPPTPLATLVMNPIGGDRWATQTMADHSWVNGFPAPGLADFHLEAVDDLGNVTTSDEKLTFDLEEPVATLSDVPLVADGPFDITFAASDADGVVSARLLIAPYHAQGNGPCESYICRSEEWEETTAIGDLFTIDPSGWGPGFHIIYVEVVDTAGNVLAPENEFDYDVGGAPGFIEGYGECTLTDPQIPARAVTSSSTFTLPPGYEPAKMRDFLADAMAAATAIDPVAALFEIRGWGIGPDGFIALDDVDPSVSLKWEYSFSNPTDQRLIEVTYWSAGRACDLPDCPATPVVEVTESDPFSHDPIVDVPGLLDSDVVAAAYALSNGCLALTGHEDDDIRYISDEPFNSFDVVRMNAVGGGEFKATATAPLTEIWACQ